MLISKKNFLKGLALVLAVLMILPAAVACADQDARTQLEEVKESILSEDEIAEIVRKVLAGDPDKVTKDDVAAAIAEAGKNQPTASQIEEIVNKAVEGLASKSDVEKAIEENNKQQEEQGAAADAALVEKIAAVKAQIAVIKEQYANKKADFSDANYAAIVSLITVAETKVGAVATADEADAVLAKLNEDLAVYAPYGLSLYTQFVALNGKVVAGKTADDEDSYAAIVAMQNLMKEAVAHYYAANNATTYPELTAYVYAKDSNGTDKTINLVTALGGVTITAGKATFVAVNVPVTESQTYETKTVNSLQDQYVAKLDAALIAAGKDVAKVIGAIGTVSLSEASQAKIAAAEEAYKAISDRFVTACKYTQVAVDAAIDSATAATTDDVAVIAAAKARTIDLQKANDALKYEVVNGKPIVEAYADFVALGITNSNVVNRNTKADRDMAKDLFDAIKTWAAAVTPAIEAKPALNQTKDFSVINEYFPDYENQYWNAFMIYNDTTTGVTLNSSGKLSGNSSVKVNTMKDATSTVIPEFTKITASVNYTRMNGVYGAMLLAGKLMVKVAAENAVVGTDITKLTAAERTTISNLAGESINIQKYAKISYDSGKKYYTYESNKSLGNSGSGALWAEAAKGVAGVDTHYIHLKGTEDGITYDGYKTSSSDAGRFLIGFNKTITEFMFSTYTPAKNQMDTFAASVAAINTDTAISAQAARELETAITTWIADTKKATGFDFTADMATTTASLTTKITTINAKVDSLSTDAATLSTAIDNINKKGVAKKYDGTTDQTDAQLAKVDTLDKKQIDAAWTLYLTFIANGGNFELQKETAKTSGGVTTYTYASIVDNKKLNKLSDAKIALDKIDAAASYYNALCGNFVAKMWYDITIDVAPADGVPDPAVPTDLDYTWFADNTADKYFLGEYKKVTVGAVTVDQWMRGESIAAAIENIKAAYAAFKTANNGEKYAPVEATLANAGYASIVFEYVKAEAIALVQASSASEGQKLAVVSVMEAATTEAALQVALNHLNTVASLELKLSVVMADFGL